ncbi:PAS domain S-box-containing protein [Quadrisphaera granulorum]|uniref:PAS domain S-box-containing protein n=1 Tax=Quadrisphaera granulorum TaxID=317664 RepID=A0A316AXG9_9ACTN|nr:SpoIIE family protein phosphatase [Quadrisphaera granulorum]PWJ54897.1 PAS domain S-box-containing protein [Quadrisphaera granulorum]SZE95843.1 PAS domain S-box-containing protein [Quadrisphaera granulorum]
MPDQHGLPLAAAPSWVSLDRDDRVVAMNRPAEALFGLRHEEVVGRSLWEIFPYSRDHDFGPRYAEARRTGAPLAFEAWGTTVERWLSVHVVPDGELLHVHLLDVTDRRRAEDALQATVRRLELLGTVSELLTRRSDQGIAVGELARLVVPELADWCTVTLVQTGRLRRTLGWAHRDPELDPVLERYAGYQAATMSREAAIAVCLRTGREVFVPALPPLGDWVGDSEARALLEVLAPASVLVVPLSSGGRTLGAMALVRTTPGVERSPAEVETAREVARRAGLALDNARLYGEQAELSSALQRSLLTAPPNLPGAELAVRYVSAAVEARIGGDWYDAFRQRDGSTALVIGDVIGHDSRAAAAMGQVRGLLRGIAHATGHRPAGVLTAVDEAVEDLELATTATAVVARLEQDGDGDRHGHVTALIPAQRRLVWSNAGHPPPLLRHPDGTVVVLEDDETDLLLGIDPATTRREHSTVLAAGSTVLLYTDGLVERRGLSLDAGIERLRATVEAVGHLPLEQLCDTVLDRMLPEEPEDDIAVLTLRVLAHP